MPTSVGHQLQAGQPSITGSYTKPLFIIMKKSGIMHKSDVVLVGNYEISGLDRIASS